MTFLYLLGVCIAIGSVLLAYMLYEVYKMKKSK